MTPGSRRAHSSMSNGFEHLYPVEPDALLGLITACKADSRPTKIDLGVGVFRDDFGITPVMKAVKEAEDILVRTQDSKSYLGAEGDQGYTALLAEVALGPCLAQSPRLAGVQTPGGTGALRLGAELLKRGFPEATVWIGEPTWPNHGPIFIEAGLQIQAHSFYDVKDASIRLEQMLAELEAARQGDILLLHGCCHNPTGATLGAEAWHAIIAICERKGLIPFIDLAYQGLGDSLEADAIPTRKIFDALPTVLLAYSCDKNFGLYRERVGALWIQSPDTKTSALVLGNTLALARSLWSMPPDHGAAIVRTILESDTLRTAWEVELAEMRNRLLELRYVLAGAHPALTSIGSQRGMFAMLPLTKTDVAALRTQMGVYMAGNGRINIAGLSNSVIPQFVASLAPYL